MTQGVIAPEVSKPKTIDSIAGWVKAATQKRNLNNPEFLRATIPFLLNCDVKEKVTPIVREWQKTPITNKAIESIYRILADYYGSQKLERAARSCESKNWTVHIHDVDPSNERLIPTDKGFKHTGETVELYSKGFATGWEAENWACLRLRESGSKAFATIDAQTEKTKLTIYRNDALARLEKRKVPCATTDQVKVSKDRLSWGVGGQYNKKFYFSRG